MIGCPEPVITSVLESLTQGNMFVGSRSVQSLSSDPCPLVVQNSGILRLHSINFFIILSASPLTLSELLFRYLDAKLYYIMSLINQKEELLLRQIPPFLFS